MKIVRHEFADKEVILCVKTKQIIEKLIRNK